MGGARVVCRALAICDGAVAKAFGKSLTDCLHFMEQMEAFDTIDVKCVRVYIYIYIYI